MFLKLRDRYINTCAVEQVLPESGGATVYFRDGGAPLWLASPDKETLLAWLDAAAAQYSSAMLRTGSGRDPEPIPEEEGPSEDDVEAWYEAATERDEVLWTLSLAELIRVVHVAYLASAEQDSRAWLVRSRCAHVLHFRHRHDRLNVLLGPLDEPMMLSHDPQAAPPFGLRLDCVYTLAELDDTPEYAERPSPLPDESEVTA